MSYMNRKDKFNPVTEALYNQKPAGLVIRRMERTQDYDALEPDGPSSFAANAPRVARESDAEWIMSKDRMEYRHKRIIEILDEMIHRLPKESFDAFLERAYSTANLALNRANKAITGDECPDLTDRWVMRFVMGFRLISKSAGVGWKVEEEALLFKLIREECDMLTKQDVQFAESRSSVRKKKRAWEREIDTSHPTDYREGIGDPTNFP